jgi:hypothetical protein
MPNHIHAQANIEDILRAQAVRTTVALIKKRARVYAKSPMLLETVYPGLSAATPETVIAVARHLIMSERDLPRRWFGAGNAKAVLLYGRAICRASSLRA